MRGGKTVEVNNTDAEGRLILADAIVRACEDGPEVLLDAATLTGAQLVALGARTAGVMGNDDALRDAVVEAAGRAGEAMWAMPLPADLRKGLDSEVADLVNTGPREGGMLTAGIFLQEFVAEGVRWAHLDIAGPSYNSASPTATPGTAARARPSPPLSRFWRSHPYGPAVRLAAAPMEQGSDPLALGGSLCWTRSYPCSPPS
jgi:leucyl aminopeptidase